MECEWYCKHHEGAEVGKQDYIVVVVVGHYEAVRLSNMPFRREVRKEMLRDETRGTGVLILGKDTADAHGEP